MLTRIHGKPVQQPVEISMKDASFPVPFAPGLEYNSAAHGTWNIVHTGMLLPGAHQIYVCADNCNRGVVLTAAEMNAMDRFSSIAIREEDFYSGQMEQKVIDGVGEILAKLPEKPTAVLLFTVCIHHFMGSDISYIYETLRKNHPDQRFLECYMDPIMQKEGRTPDEKLRAALYGLLEHDNPCRKQVSLVGSDFSIQKDAEIVNMMEQGGYRVLQLPSCKSFEEYRMMGDSGLQICTYPPGRYGGELLARRLGTEFLYLPFTFGFEENDRQLALLAETLDLAMPDTESLRERTIQKLNEVRKLVADTPIIIDMSVCPRPLGLARMLLTYGFDVECIFTDAFSPEEKDDYIWLKEYAPRLLVRPIIHPSMRCFHPPEPEKKVLALGQKAAYFYRTPYFLNIVQGGGLHGYHGIMEFLRLMEEAFSTEKETQDLIVRKGLGCESCI